MTFYNPIIPPFIPPNFHNTANKNIFPENESKSSLNEKKVFPNKYPTKDIFSEIQESDTLILLCLIYFLFKQGNNNLIIYILLLLLSNT